MDKITENAYVGLNPHVSWGLWRNVKNPTLSTNVSSYQQKMRISLLLLAFMANRINLVEY